MKGNKEDFEIGLKAVLNKYYSKSKSKRKELKSFETEIAPEAKAVLANYQEAEAERENQGNLSFATGEVLISFPYGTPISDIEAVVENEAVNYEIIDDGDYNIPEDLPDYKKERLAVLKDKKSDIIISAEITLEDTVARTVKKFESYDCVSSASSNVILESDGSISNGSITINTNDPSFNETDQWNLKNIDVPKAWNRFKSVNSMYIITVAVIDSGVQMNHPDLKNALMEDCSVDVTTTNNTRLVNLPNVEAANGQYTAPHGTMVSGIIMAEGNNKQGIAGVASIPTDPYYDNPFLLMAIKCDNNGTTDDRHITQKYLHKAVKYAVENGAEIINISYSQFESKFDATSFSNLKTQIANAIKAGVVVVGSAGNDGGTTPRYPAAFPSVIGVGAIYKNGSLASYSNRSSAVDIVAPGGYTDSKGGVEILSTKPGGYGVSHGTSFAAPHVAGTVAMMKSINYFLTPDQYLSRLISRGNTSTKHSFIELDAGEAVRLMQEGQ